jgi:hypothetical protein
MYDDAPLLKRAEEYAQSRQIVILRKERLGHGSDGSVWKTTRPSAVKALYEHETYQKELECYSRLKRAAIRNLGGFDIPVLEDSDDGLMVIEMTLVEPTFLLDFGKVYLDQPPTYLYDKELMSRAYAEWRERFGRRWMDVAFVLELLKKYGIYYFDPRPSNIDTGEDDNDDDFQWSDGTGVCR